MGRLVYTTVSLVYVKWIYVSGYDCLLFVCDDGGAALQCLVYISSSGFLDMIVIIGLDGASC